MLRQINPRNARSKRALEKREPKPVENPKTTLFLKGTNASEISQLAMKDLNALKEPFTIKFSKKNNVHPFEDATSLEFFSEKNDASLMVFASSNKKRPHNLTFVRFFDHKVYDMIELLVDPDNFRTLSQFKTQKAAIGLRPILSFSSPLFESPSDPRFVQLKSILADFFGGPQRDGVDVEGLQYLISISAGESTDTSVEPKVHLRTYLVKTKRSGTKLPRVELEEMGPRMDFRIGRAKEPDTDMAREALRRAKTSEPRTKKNVETDLIGDKLGRIHVGKQDLSKLQSRKMKGLKRSRDEATQFDSDDDVGHLEEDPKRARS